VACFSRYARTADVRTRPLLRAAYPLAQSGIENGSSRAHVNHGSWSLSTHKIRGRILCFFGERDGYIPPEQVARIRQELERHKIRHEVVVYPNVGHGFFCDERPDYNESAASDAWRRVKELFRDELR